MITKEKPPLTDEFVHSGVKGMKWGVRKQYTSRLQNRVNRNLRVASKTASVKDKLVTGLTTTPLQIATGGPGTRAKRDQAHINRIRQGKTTTADLIRLYGTVRLVDIRKK